MSHELSTMIAGLIIASAGVAAFQYYKSRNSNYIEYLERRCQTEYFQLKIELINAYSYKQLESIPRKISDYQNAFAKVPVLSNYLNKLSDLYRQRESELFINVESN